MKKSTYFVLSTAFLFLSLAGVSSCNKDKTEVEVIVPEACPDTISFSGFVEPLIQANCSTSGCHDVTATAGYDLLGYTNISTHANSILTAIKHENSGAGMPIGQPKFNDSIIDRVNCWIDQGTLNN